MTGPEHYREAERLLSQASHESITGTPVTRQGMPMRPAVHAALIARAQVHATLALTAATAIQESAADTARSLAEQVTTLGKARGWSTWAADYIHPDREFVDTGVRPDTTKEN